MLKSHEITNSYCHIIRFHHFIIRSTVSENRCSTGADASLYSKSVWIVDEHSVAELKECSEEEDPPRVSMELNKGSETC